YRSFDLAVLEQPINGPDEILIVDPGDVLAAVSRPPSQTVPYQTQQHIEYAAAVRAHRHRRAQRNLARLRYDRFIEGAFPTTRHVDAESPRIRRTRLGTAQDAGRLVVRGVVAVSIDRGSAGLEPHGRWPGCARYGLAHNAGRVYARFGNVPAVARVVPAVY